jgi:segregation and condensation protein A
MAPVQQELPLAIVQGEQVTAFPEDLYIPPDALEVILDSFEGPLDLLLYLIRRQNLDILDIPIAEITVQYMAYVEVMHKQHLDLAAEYLLMAALLAEIKSRLLLPQRTNEEDGEEDPRAELVRRLQEYERFKQAAEGVDELEREERDFSVIKIEPVTEEREIPQPEVSLDKLMHVFNDILQRVDLKVSHQIKRETISIRARMTDVLDRLTIGEYVSFENLLLTQQGRLGVVVTFMAILELLKSRVIDLKQDDPFGSIYVIPVSAAQEVGSDESE